ncbi:hypothetical protein BS50DRAFT_573162 [Corynespora cassiicola Philippines]|uniref:DUF7703 domain-containing protein n=1 Tax=Corynespora cassiicola Philippines TaxID=1448308 RepID=A0A2T2NS31_CORCC|nr:hypothetical protein BS50DRAFT_573162 [Corynespora cassiicola Philippines]
MANDEDVGIVGGVNVGLPILMTMSAFLAIAFYNVIEISVFIFAVFKQRHGLYFWSLIVANWGIIPHGIGFVLKFFQVTRLDLVSSAIVGLGWVCMVTGQSVVLYSRLHLVVRDWRKIRWVLYLIIFNAVFLGIPTFVLAMGTNSKHSDLFLPGFMVVDKIQIVVFCVQEAIISVIYIYETVLLLGHGGNNKQGPLRKLLRHLILVNVVVLIFDVSLLAVQFSGHYEIQTTYKTAVYSVKLKIEFSVLNRLVKIVKHKDLISNQRTRISNVLSMVPWASKKSQFSTSPGGPGSFVKMNEIERSNESGKTATSETTEIRIEREVIVHSEDKSVDLEAEENGTALEPDARSAPDIKRPTPASSQVNLRDTE